MTTHTHYAYRSSEPHAWLGCVAAKDCDGSAHGGFVRLDECQCGAQRRTEVNGSHETAGNWHMPQTPLTE